jgi:NodT family efflux transporter outer membrane factor (OMF) lipoprotein
MQNISDVSAKGEHRPFCSRTEAKHAYIKKTSTCPILITHSRKAPAGLLVLPPIGPSSRLGQQLQPGKKKPSTPAWRSSLQLTLISLAGLLLAAQLASCTPALRSAEPPLPIPEEFSSTGEEIVPDRWWLAFEDPLLNTLISQALTDNFDLRTARDRLHQAEAVARRAGADMAPDLRGEASVSRSSGSGNNSASRNYSLGAVAAYEVDLWGRLRERRQAAALSAAASREDMQAAAISLSAQVASIWYQLVEERGQQDLLTGQLAINNQVLELVTLRFRRGQASAADVLQQRQLVHANQGQQAQVQSRISVLSHRLAILLGLPPQQTVVPKAAVLLEVPSLPRTGLPSELIQRRPDLRRAHYRVLGADHNLAAALADRFPRFSLTARGSTGGSEVSDIFSNWLTSFAANLIGPIIDGGSRTAEIDRSRAVAAEELNAYGRVVLEALAEVEDALSREARQRELITSLDQQLLLAEEVTELVRDRYFRGAENYLRVLDALARQQGLQRNRLAAQRQLIQDRIDLYRALGGGWTDVL